MVDDKEKPVNNIIKAAAIEHLDKVECRACMSRCMNHELGNEHVRTDIEIRDASASLASAAGIMDNLIKSLADSMDDYKTKAKDLYDVEYQLSQKRKELTEIEAMAKIEKFGSFSKKVYGVASAIGVGIMLLSAWVGSVMG